MRRIQSFYSMGLLAALFCIGFLFWACSDDDDPDENVNDIPDCWGEENCPGEYKIKASDISGFTNNEGYLWMGIAKNDSLIEYGDGIYIQPGNFQQDIMWVSINNLEIPEDNYDVYIFVSEDIASVGDIEERIISSRPFKIGMDYSEFIAGNCVEGILGDSLFLQVVESFGEYVLEVSPYQVDYQGYNWQVYYKSGQIDGQWLVNLDSNGLFFPLKVSDSLNGLNWIVRAENLYAPYNTVMTDVVIRGPHSLGSSNNQYDEAISYWSNEYGIPPQIIKAIIDQETDFRIQRWLRKFGQLLKVDLRRILEDRQNEKAT